VRIWRRQIVLFLVAIHLPAGALIGLAVHTASQAWERAAKTGSRPAARGGRTVRRELVSHLEAIKLQEINRLMRPADSSNARGPANPAVIFTAKMETTCV
jgi:hypothetical protein